MNTIIEHRHAFPQMVLTAPRARQAAPGHELVNLEGFGIFLGLMGADGGYHTLHDALVTQTADQVDLNALWAEYQQTLEIFNQRRSALVNLLTFPVNNPIENVPQVGSTEFEEATEFGVPKSVRVTLGYFQLGYDFRDYDIATRYTWKFLRDADARAVNAVHNAILEADNRLQFRRVMEAIFDNRNRLTDIHNSAISVYPLYNADGTVPPSYKGTTFTGTHTHYLLSGGTPDGALKVHVDSGDLEAMMDHITHHGFGQDVGTTFVLLANRIDVRDIRTFKAGVANFNGAVALYDFIPNANSPTVIVPNAQGLLGSVAPTTFNGLRVVGSYGDVLIIEEDYIPENYLFMFGTGGTGNLQNLVGLREHANAAYRGLRLIPGNQQGYPLVDSFYSRSFGTGIRQRAGGVVMQLKQSGSYDIPVNFTRGLGNG
jgi:hypothetical protein